MKLDKIIILVFAYNRPSHLKRVLVALEDYKISSDIAIIVDGPKNKIDAINQKNIFTMATRFNKRKSKLIKRKKNLGLAKSINLGIDYFSKKYEGLIILEDDVVPYKSFFLFIKENFKKYLNNKKIAAICGYTPEELNYKIKNKKLFSILLKNFIPWGWCISSKKWLELRNLKNRATIKSKVPTFFRKKFNSNYRKKKKKDIWTLDFIYKNYLKNNFYIFPNVSLVKNIGFDGTGVNSKVTDLFNVMDKKFKIKKSKDNFLLDEKLVKKQNDFFKKNLNLFY